MFDIQGLRGPPGVSGPQGPAGHNVRFTLIYSYRDNSVIVASLAKGYIVNCSPWDQMIHMAMDTPCYMFCFASILLNEFL